MLKNAGKSWKILFTLIIPRALNFSAFSRDLLQRRSAGFSVVHGLFKFFFVSKQSCHSCSHFAFGFIGWTRVSHGCWANGLSLYCRRRRPDSFVLLQKKKRELAPGYIWMDEETGVFLSLMQGDKTTIGYFNWMKLKNKKKRCRGRRPWPLSALRKSPGSWKGFDRRDSSRHFSPWLFETSGWCHSIMPSLFILFIQCWKIQFILFKN